MNKPAASSGDRGFFEGKGGRGEPVKSPHPQASGNNCSGSGDGLEGFWGYLKRTLTSKGGIRREKLPVYLGEYVWRYRDRKDTDKKKIKGILKLSESEFGARLQLYPN